MRVGVVSAGLQASQCLHSDTGPTAEHSGGLLEADVGVQEQSDCHALFSVRGRPGGLSPILAI